MIDFTKYTIKQIRFEKWGFETDAFTAHHAAIADRLGKNGMKNAIDKLKHNGYMMKDISDSDGDDIVATLVTGLVF
jgi:hypothetical protein